MRYFLILFSIFWVSCAHVETRSLTIDESLGRWEKVPVPKNLQVILVPQWHLSAHQNTKIEKGFIPQEKNQLAIYKQLLSWREQRPEARFIFEGCEGELKDLRALSFNGWTWDALRNEVANKKESKAIEPILTHMGLKLSAEFPDEKNVYCGDNLKKIDAHQLVLSDLRGLIGFKMRIQEMRKQNTSYEKHMTALRGVLKIPEEKNEDFILKKLDDEILKSLDQFGKLTSERNSYFIDAVEKEKNALAVIVIGALHVDDLRMKLEKKEINYIVWQPEGLADSPDQLLKDLRVKIGL